MKEETLSKSHEKILNVLVDCGGITYPELARKSGVSYDGVRGRISELKQMGYNIVSTRIGKLAVVKLERARGLGIKDLDVPVTKRETVLVREQGVTDYFNIVEILNTLKKAKPFKKKKIKSKERAAVLVLSDLHIGMKHVTEQGELLYNTDIAEERMEDLTIKTIERLHENNIDFLYINMLGDLVDGDMIYKHHSFEIEKPAIDQTQDATRFITRMIRTLSEHDITVEVNCVRGNHGITNYKNLDCDNWDNVVYNMLELIFEDDEYVLINNYKGGKALVDLLDKQAVIYHGEKMGEQCKTASGLRNFRGLSARFGLESGDMIFVGHLHTFGVESDQEKFLIRNGALCPTNEYALSLNLFSTSSQTLVILEEGVNHPIFIPIEVE